MFVKIISTNMPESIVSPATMTEATISVTESTTEPCPAMAEVTVITSRKPRTLSKKFRLGANGGLIKETSAHMTMGFAKVVKLKNLADLQQILLNLKTSQALCYGRPEVDLSTIVTQEKLLKVRNEGGDTSRMTARTNEMFHWPDCAGIMFLDYDPSSGSSVLSREALVSAIREVAPALKEVKKLWVPSSSSHIFNGDTDMTGLKGQRIYLMVSDATDIERAGRALVDRLWASGYGYIAISRSGQLLKRTLVDATVWQPSRLDFAAGADCSTPLKQHRGEPIIISGQKEFVDTRVALADDSGITATAIEMRQRAEIDCSKEAESVRATWIEERVAAIVGEKHANVPVLNLARKIAEQAIENGVLSGTFPLLVIRNGRWKEVTVEEVLNNPEEYHGLQTLDPLEPEYDGGRSIGKLFLDGQTKNLYSFAHGGCNYVLTRLPQPQTKAEIQVLDGESHDATNQTLEIMRSLSAVFDLGDSLVSVGGGRIYPLDEHGLKYLLGGEIQYWTLAKNVKSEKRQNVDPPANVAKAILSLGGQRHLKQLKAVVTAPTLRANGSILNSPGFDSETGLLVVMPKIVAVPEEPTVEQVLESLNVLLFPFRKFPLQRQIDWTVLLCALLTAVIRVSLPASPAFGIDAPVQGSGKTLLARCLAILGAGEDLPVWPHTGGKDDEEMRKRLLTALRNGVGCLIIDNILGVFDSASLASVLTSPTFTDRILGRNEAPILPMRTLCVLTGNNLTLAGDMPRRVLVCRIDPRMDTPHAREFDLDPIEYTTRHRIEMVIAALTIIRGWLSSEDFQNGNRALGRMASFENWDDLVRQPVVWISRTLDSEHFCDPMEAVNEAQKSDPEREALGEFLEALKDMSPPDGVTAKTLCEYCRNCPDSSLAEALRDLTGTDNFTSKGVGRTLGYREGRIVNGLRLAVRKDPHSKSSLWRVEG